MLRILIWYFSMIHVVPLLFMICDPDGAARSDGRCPGSWTQDQEVPDLPLGPRHRRRQTTNADIWSWSQHVSHNQVHEHNIVKLFLSFYIISVIICWHVFVDIAVVQWFWMPLLRSRMRSTPHSHSGAPAERVRNKSRFKFKLHSDKMKWNILSGH